MGTFTTGTCPDGVAFDGANIWVTNASSNTITKLLASDGHVLGTFPVAQQPMVVAFDGTNIWVVSYSTVTKLRASDGAILETFAVSQRPYAIAFDGANIWVGCLNNPAVTSCGRPTEPSWGRSTSLHRFTAWPLTEPTFG